MIRTIITNEEAERFMENPRSYLGFLGIRHSVVVYKEIENEQLRLLTEATMIKNRRERIEFIYDNACRIIDEYNKEHDIFCEFEEGRCKDCRHNWHINGCCFHCPYQTDHGCPTCNLSCKLYFCDYMAEKNPLTIEDIPLLRLLTKSQLQIVKENVFTDRKTAINLLYIGSYLVFGLYSFIKVIRMKNIFKKPPKEK